MEQFRRASLHIEAASVSASEGSSTGSSDLSAESISDADDVLREETSDSAYWHPVTDDHAHVCGELAVENSDDLSDSMITSQSDLLSTYSPCCTDSDCTSTSSNAASGGKALQMMDLSNLTWTDDKHRKYLSLIEATFVRKMYGREYCSLDLCGQEPQQADISEPDCVESKPSFTVDSASGSLKLWKKEDSHGMVVSSKPFLSQKSVSVPRVFSNPWIKHFRANESRQKTVALMRTSTSYIRNSSRDKQLDSESSLCSSQPCYNGENMQPAEWDSGVSRKTLSFCKTMLQASESEERPLKMLKVAQAP